MSMKITLLIFAFLFSGFEVVASTKAEVTFCERQLVTNSPADIFRKKNPLALSLKAEFQRIHKANEGGNWTGEDRSDPKYWSTGELIDLSNPSRAYKVQVRARGMSSADDVKFPKLRLEIDDSEDLKGSVFKGARNFRINTHIDTNPTSTHTDMGRLNGENSPLREALAYEIAQAMGLLTPGIRLARMDYTEVATGQRFTRNALLIETDKKIAERIGGKVSQTFPETNAIPIQTGSLYLLFHALIGNSDIGLKIKDEPTMGTELYRPYFNSTVFDLPSGAQVPLVYDLDLASIMTDLNAIGRNFLIDGFDITSPYVTSAMFQLSHLRSRLSKSEFDQAIANYQEARPKMNEIIRSAIVDDEGRRIAQAHVDAFDQAIRILAKTPMLLKNGVRFFEDKALKNDKMLASSADETPGTLRPGTPIVVLEQTGKVVKIAVVDFKYDLVDSSQNIGYIKKSDLIAGFDLPADLQGVIDSRDFAGKGP